MKARSREVSVRTERVETAGGCNGCDNREGLKVRVVTLGGVSIRLCLPCARYVKERL